jgi:glycosyltransferase involved in cell wall biosynthesis
MPPTPIGLIASLPPQVGGVASVAEWLLAQEEEIGCSYSAFDLERAPNEEMGGRFRLGAVPRQLGQLARFVRWARGSPVVAHYCLSTSGTGLPRDAVYVALLRLFGRRTIAHIHGSSLADAAAAPVRSSLLRLVGRWTAERVAISPTAAGVLEGIGVSSRCILNPVRFEPEEFPVETQNGALRLLFVGAYGRRKGCPELIEALAKVRADGHDVTLRIVGKPDQKGDEELVAARIAATGTSDAIEFAGVLSADELPRSYRAADVVCLPSWHEGLPMALLEAMAFGVPIVATRAGGIGDLVVHGSTGLLVEPGDVEALAGAIRALAEDSDLRRRMGADGLARVRALASSAAIAAEWRGLYESLADSGSSRADFRSPNSDAAT